MDHAERWEHRLADLGQRLAVGIGEIAAELEAAIAAAIGEQAHM